MKPPHLNSARGYRDIVVSSTNKYYTGSKYPDRETSMGAEFEGDRETVIPACALQNSRIRDAGTL